MNVETTRKTECLLYMFKCTGMLPFEIGKTMLTNVSMHWNVYVIWWDGCLSHRSVYD